MARHGACHVVNIFLRVNRLHVACRFKKWLRRPVEFKGQKPLLSLPQNGSEGSDWLASGATEAPFAGPPLGSPTRAPSNAQK